MTDVATAAPVKPQIVRDTVLEQRMLEAVIADRNDQPRNKQVQVGPSSIGFCRELLRAGLFEGNLEALHAPETQWAAAAHVGTVMGADLERIFGVRLSALEQQRVTTYLAKIGVSISGSLDLIFLDSDVVTDLKSTTDIGGVLYDLEKNAAAIETLLMIWREGNLYNHNVETPDGGYELTEAVLSRFSKLHYYVQLAVYVTGAVQAGILSPQAEGRLVFYDRAGDYQDFVALVITAEELAMFFDIGQERVLQVAQAQEAYEATGGNPAVIAKLRDQTPSFCFSKKVMCPLRDRCWGGSDWDPEQAIDTPEVVSSVDRYIRGRDMEKMGKAMRAAAREELRGIEGRLTDGRAISWTGASKNTINVVETLAQKPKIDRSTPGKELEGAAAEQQIALPVDVHILESGAIFDNRPDGVDNPVDRERMQRLSKLQNAVAASRTSRAQVTRQVTAEFEERERQQYGGRTLPEHLGSLAVDAKSRSEALSERNAAIIEAVREKLG